MKQMKRIHRVLWTKLILFNLDKSKFLNILNQKKLPEKVDDVINEILTTTPSKASTPNKQMRPQKIRKRIRKRTHSLQLKNHLFLHKPKISHHCSSNQQEKTKKRNLSRKVHIQIPILFQNSNHMRQLRRTKQKQIKSCKKVRKQ